ncbi:hypothetical protein LX36DRAFT_427314 [Colletotrichum falcatum]|nr:hypothetical protein LX36DRAFT_427314 [Colletotrichum falcatum]
MIPGCRIALESPDIFQGDFAFRTANGGCRLAGLMISGQELQGKDCCVHLERRRKGQKISPLFDGVEAEFDCILGGSFIVSISSACGVMVPLSRNLTPRVFRTWKMHVFEGACVLMNCDEGEKRKTGAQGTACRLLCNRPRASKVAGEAISGTVCDSRRKVLDDLCGRVQWMMHC